jgi:hypothetical protein
MNHNPFRALEGRKQSINFQFHNTATLGRSPAPAGYDGAGLPWSLWPML